MSINLIIENLRGILSDEKWVSEESFTVLNNLSVVINNTIYDAELENEARELVIRTLEYRHLLCKNDQKLLDTLVRQVGLFPYLAPENLPISDLLAYEYHRPLNMDEDIVFHSAQAEAYRKLLSGISVVLSAPTSFGKSLIIDAIISSGKFKNIVIVVPTIALIDETRRRLLKFGNEFKIITHNEQERSEKNIFVMTQEKALIYPDLEGIDFFVIDEFYKLDLESDNDRACSLNQVFYKLYKTGAQFYLLGPNIKGVPKSEKGKLEYYFMETDFCTVITETKYISPEPSAEEVTLNICKELQEPTLVYCRSPISVRKLVLYFLESGFSSTNSSLDDAIYWLCENYHPDWLLVRALKSGIGIHHGRVPRAIGQFIVRAFNQGLIKFLFCTSTLIEGVNTSAKNVIVYDNKIAQRKLDFFTFNNIRGRSGRMFKHFIGKVFILNEEPMSELPVVDFPAFTQGENAPEELLVQIDWEDLSKESKQRIEYVFEQDFLEWNVIKENYGINPADQIELAKMIKQNANEFYKFLNWRNYPKDYNDLKFACQIIWEPLGAKSKSSSVVRSYNQLCYKIWQIYQGCSVKDMIIQEIENGSNADDAVENTLDFMRNWAAFYFPQYMRALDNIQKSVFSDLGYKPGNFSLFTDSIENLLMYPAVTALDEYGLPYQITLKISDYLSLEKGLDFVLEEIHSLNIDKLDLLPFEKELLSDFQKY